MSFPFDPLPIRADLFLDSAWRDVTDRVRGAGEVVISGRGRANEQGSHSSSSCNFTLNNRDGLFSKRNPLGTYYGNLGKNIPFRVAIEETTPYLFLPPAGLSEDHSRIATTDKAVLDIISDIDIRMEIQPDYRRIGGGTLGQLLVGKYENVTGNQRSWAFYLTAQGYLQFGWSSNGVLVPATAGTLVTSTAMLPELPDRIAVRVTLDVNNGAAGRTAVFYTSDSISGSWTQLGSTVIQSGTTSIFSSTAPLEIGSISEAGTPFTDVVPYRGRVYAFELYSGIAGTLVAKMDATSRTPGDTSWSDGLTTPNTWTRDNDAEITLYNHRFCGEVSELPHEWDSTGADVYVPTTASTIGRRLTQGETPLKSAVFRNLSSYSFTAYVPLEDNGESTQASNFYPGGLPGQVVDVTFGVQSEFPASAGVARIGSSASRIRVSNSPGPRNFNSGAAEGLLMYFRLPSIPVSDVVTWDWFFSNGPLRKVNFTITPTTYKFTCYDQEYTIIHTENTAFGSGAEPNQWIAMEVTLYNLTPGAALFIQPRWRPIATPSLFYDSGATIAGTVGQNPGHASYASVGGSSLLAGAEFAHVMLYDEVANFSITDTAFGSAMNAYIDEPAGERFLRLAGDEDVFAYCVGNPSQTVPMGAQTPATLSTLLNECVAADGGMLDEPRHRLGLVMRTKASFYQQSPESTLNYEAKDLSGVLRPTDDDLLLRNYVTATRPSGGTYVAAKTSGPNNINDPAIYPDGAGKYDTVVTRNVASDGDLRFVASEEVYLGTWDEDRYPVVQVNLERQNFYGSSAKLALAARMAHLNVGDRLRLEDLPIWCGYEPAELLIQGYTETLRNRGWEFRWNTSPYGPYLAMNDGSLSAQTRYRAADNGNSLVTTSLDTVDTSFDVQAFDEDNEAADPTPLWGSTANKPGNFPLDIYIGGERMTVSAIGGPVVDAFGRTSVSSFGSADVGGAYVTSGGAAANYNVSAGSARITNASTNVARLVWLPDQVTTDVDVYCTISVSAVATGASLLPFIIIQLADASNYLRFEPTFSTAGTVDARIRSVFGGVATSQQFVTVGLPYSAGTLVRCRVQAKAIPTRSFLRFKIWLASTDEPVAWTAKAGWSVESVVRGSIGLGSIANTGNTNVNPESRFDDLEVIHPQRFTLSARSVNGVVKSHDAFSKVTVADKFYAVR